MFGSFSGSEGERTRNSSFFFSPPRSSWLGFQRVGFSRVCFFCFVRSFCRISSSGFSLLCFFPFPLSSFLSVLVISYLSILCRFVSLLIVAFSFLVSPSLLPVPLLLLSSFPRKASSGIRPSHPINQFIRRRTLQTTTSCRPNLSLVPKRNQNNEER